jgi:uncharacterized protein YhaN
MRIAQLELIAFGPFRGLDLDFSKPGIHVVFGRNEAGKSTTLRAITGLLYGIPVQTLDAHLHKPADLRVGGTLVGGDGSRLRVVRRKGASKTLLDETGQAIDDAVLQRLLHGVTQSTFENAFGLDLDTLHEGAKALLAGGGDVGGSLFDASVGGGGDARRLLKQLVDEADAIYKPRGSTLPLNEAMKAFTEATKAIKETQRLPESVLVQENGLADARKRRAELAAQKSQLAERKAQITRARRRIPLERKRAQALAVLGELGEVARHATRIASLSSRLAAYERAMTAHRDDTAASERLRDRVAEAARRAGVAASASGLRIDVRTQARIQKFLRERTTLTERLEVCRAEIARDERELTRQRASVPAAESLDAVANAALERAVEQARKLGDLATRTATELARAARRRADVESKAKAAGSFEGPIEALVLLRLPSESVLDGLASRADAAERALARHADRAAALEAQLLTLEQQLAEASGDFAPPTAADLRAARDVRDEAWASVRDARSGGADTKTLAALDSAFERAVRDADVLADRMIHEADRVTTLARLRAQQTTRSGRERPRSARRSMPSTMRSGRRPGSRHPTDGGSVSPRCARGARSTRRSWTRSQRCARRSSTRRRALARWPPRARSSRPRSRRQSRARRRRTRIARSSSCSTSRRRGSRVSMRRAARPPRLRARSPSWRSASTSVARRRRETRQRLRRRGRASPSSSRRSAFPTTRMPTR